MNDLRAWSPASEFRVYEVVDLEPAPNPQACKCLWSDISWGLGSADHETRFAILTEVRQ